MTFDEALETVVARTGWTRYRDLCDPSHPSHEAYRRVVMELATGPPPSPPAPAAPFIPLAGDLVDALARRIGAKVVARLIEKYLGAPCGCEARRIKLNKLDALFRKLLGSHLNPWNP